MLVSEIYWRERGSRNWNSRLNLVLIILQQVLINFALLRISSAACSDNDQFCDCGLDFFRASALPVNITCQSLSPFSPQMERPGPAGGVAEPLCGAHVPAQRHHRQPAPHRPPGQSSEPAAGASGPAARHAQAQSAPAQRYEHQSTNASAFGPKVE